MSKRNRSRTRSARRLGTGVLALTAIGAGFLVPQLAAGETEGPATRQGQNTPEDHYAGSQIAKHEPSDGAPPALQSAAASTDGLDVSGHQGAVNWAEVAADGGEFAYVKATEGTEYTSPDFVGQYTGAYQAGLIRGAYHFALPNVSTGSTQADFFVNHGGGWRADGKTLPPALDLEYNPYGESCYGKNPKEMVRWIAGFSDELHAETGRYPAIYTSAAWWNECTGGSTEFAKNSPLWIPRYGSSVGTLPAGWGAHTIWQYDDAGRFPGDQNYFNGTKAQLRKLAKG